MNKGTFWGFLSKDPDELKRYGDKTKGRIIVAVRRKTKNADSQYPSDFIPVVTWGKTAENCEKYLRKGSPVAVEFHLQTGSYEDNEGKRRFTLDVVADAVEFLPNRKDSSDNKHEDSSALAADEDFSPVSVDDLPF